MNKEKLLEELSKVPTKKKRKMLCRELLAHKKLKEYIKLMKASDEEVEHVFSELYNPFIESLVLKEDVNEW